MNIYTTIKTSAKLVKKTHLSNFFLPKAYFLCYFTLRSTSENVTHLS